jgi:hypothetical protein
MSDANEVCFQADFTVVSAASQRIADVRVESPA